MNLKLLIYCTLALIFIGSNFFDSSILFSGIFRFIPYLIDIVAVVFVVKGTVTKKEQIYSVIIIICIGILYYLWSQVSGIGCVSAGQMCLDEINNRQYIFLIFSIVSVLFVLSSKTQK